MPLPERSGWWACHSLSLAGHRVLAAHHLPGPHRLPPGVEPPILVPDPSTRPAEFREMVAEICRAEGVAAVLTLDDETQKALLSGPGLPEGTAMCGPDADQYLRLCDKRELAVTAAAVGIRHPRSVVVERDGTPEAPWPDLPVIVKPLLSEPGSVGGEITVCHTEAELEETVDRLAAATGGAMVQEFIAGTGMRLQFVRDPVGLAAVLATTVRRWPPITGMSSVSTYGPGPPEIMDAAERLLAHVGYVGGGEVQFLGSVRDLVVHDVNLRPSMGVGGTIRAGLDQPRLMVEVALGGSVPVAFPVTRHRYVWRTGELRQLSVAVGGGQADGTAGAIARDLVRAAVHPRGMIDPTDARSLGAEVSRITRRAARRFAR